MSLNQKFGSFADKLEERTLAQLQGRASGQSKAEFPVAVDHRV